MEMTQEEEVWSQQEEEKKKILGELHGMPQETSQQTKKKSMKELEKNPGQRVESTSSKMELSLEKNFLDLRPPYGENQRDETRLRNFFNEISEIDPLNLNNFIDVQDKQEVSNLKEEDLDDFSKITVNLEEERILRMAAQLFQKMIAFNSKIEELKNSLYEMSPNFDVLSVFELYDEEFKGSLAPH